MRAEAVPESGSPPSPKTYVREGEGEVRGRVEVKDEPVGAGAVGSTALGSHFGASLEDLGPNVVL